MGGFVQRTEAAEVVGNKPRWAQHSLEFRLATLPQFVRLYCFDELCPPPSANVDGGLPVLARRYDVDALLGVGEADWVAGAEAGPFEETRWVDLQHPAGGDVLSDQLLLWQDSKSAGRLQVHFRWNPPSEKVEPWVRE